MHVTYTLRMRTAEVIADVISRVSRKFKPTKKPSIQYIIMNYGQIWLAAGLKVDTGKYRHTVENADQFFPWRCELAGIQFSQL